MTTRNQDPPLKSDLFFPYETPTTTGVSFDPAHHTASSEHPPAYVAQDENFSFFDFARAFNSAAASAATNTSEDTIGSTPLMYPSMHGQAHLSPTGVQEEEPFLFHGDFKTEERPQRCLDDLLFASSAPADESPTSISTAFGWPSLSTPQSIAPRHMMGPEEEETSKEHAASTTHAPTVVCGVSQQQELTHSSVFGASRNYPQQENRHEPPHSDIPLRMKHAVDSVDQYEKVPPSSLLQKKPTANKERAILRAQDVNVEVSQETESGLPITTSFAQTSEFCRMASTTTEHPIQHGTEAIEVEAGTPSTSVSDLSSSATKSIRRKPIPNGHRDDTTNPSSGTLQMNHLLHIGAGSEVEHVLGELYDAVQQADSMLSTPFPPPGVGQKLSRSTSQIEEPVNESVPLTSVTTQPGGMEYVPLRRCQELMDRIDKSVEEMRTLTAEIVRTTTDLLQRCASPNLKLQGYSAAKTLKAQVSDIWQQIDAYEGRA